VSASSSRYSVEVRALFERLPGAVALETGEGTAVTGETVALERGAWVRFDAKVGTGRLLACEFRAWGCPHVLAAAARTAACLSGSDLAQATPVAARELQQALGAPAEKLGRLLVVEDAAAALLAAARAVQCR
jgi:NifU-like protein involved in Fe-S cluster formation